MRKGGEERGLGLVPAACVSLQCIPTLGATSSRSLWKFLPMRLFCVQRVHCGIAPQPSSGVWPIPSIQSANQVCAKYCSTFSGAFYAGVEAGTDCFCGEAGEDFAKNGPLGEENCATLCDSNPEATCGGVDAIEVR